MCVCVVHSTVKNIIDDLDIIKWTNMFHMVMFLFDAEK